MPSPAKLYLDPLVPNYETTNSKCFIWCRLGSSVPLFLSLSCTEVVPKLRNCEHWCKRAWDNVSQLEWLVTIRLPLRPSMHPRFGSDNTRTCKLGECGFLERMRILELRPTHATPPSMNLRSRKNAESRQCSAVDVVLLSRPADALNWRSQLDDGSNRCRCVRGRLENKLFRNFVVSTLDFSLNWRLTAPS